MCLIPASKITLLHYNGFVRTLPVFVLRLVRKSQIHCLGDMYSCLVLQRMVRTVTTEEYAGT